jgi:hypothetical protein
MRFLRSRWLTLAAVAVHTLWAGAALAQAPGDKPVAEVKMYNLGDPNAPRYDVVSRLWGDASAWWLTTYPTQEQAVVALQAEAAKRGADALFNVTCLDQGRARWYKAPAPAFLCYGIAVRVRAG